MKQDGEGKKKKWKKKEKQPEDTKKGANDSEGSSDECVGEKSYVKLLKSKSKNINTKKALWNAWLK